MPGQARHKIVRHGEIATYHCWSRCVQRAFLCGQDSYTGDNYDYRRDWIERLLEYQAGVFAVDVGNHNVLSNHLHLIARTRPDIAVRWSDQECRAIVPNRSPRRTPSATEEPDWGQSGYNWEQRFGCREIVDEQALLTCMVYVDLNQVKAGMAATLEDSRTSAIAARLAAWRAREAQASLEEFHSSRRSRGGGYDLSPEQIEALLKDAWLAPIETGGLLITQSVAEVTGSSSELKVAGESEAVLPDAPCVDSELDLACHQVAARDSFPGSPDSQPGSLSSSMSLESTSLEPSGKTDSGVCNETSSEVPPADCGSTNAAAAPPGAPSHTRYRRLFRDAKRRRRASDNPILDMSLSDYVRILQWVVAQTTAARTAPDSDPSELVQHLRTYSLAPDRWAAAVDNFDEWFGRAVGSVERLRELLDRTGDRWVKGMRNCRATFG